MRSTLNTLHLEPDPEEERPETADEMLTGVPKVFTRPRKVKGKLSLPGIGNPEADIMIVAIAPQEEELRQAERLHSGVNYRFPAKLLKGPHATVLKELCSRSGFEIDECWYTTLVKWMPEKGAKRPSKDEIAFWATALDEEIKRVKPKVIICLGKPVFDHFFHKKLAYRDLGGGWFWSESHKVKLYPCDDAGAMAFRPELYGRFAADFQEIGRMRDRMQGVEINEVERHYQVVRNKAELIDFVTMLKTERRMLLSVDCEWKGNQHVDGELRSIQFAWKDGHGAYIRFMDDKGNYAFDCSYKEAGEILALHLDDPDVRYVGHHIAADFPWMAHVLGLKVFEKALIDTEFALQCCDETADLGLDRLAMSYTDLGRYDVDLMLWLKDNPQPDGAGYGFIPDDILIDYAIRDVDSVFRSAPKIFAYMQREGVLDYYVNIFHPFVTDVFTEFALNGLPMDENRMSELREIFHKARRLMEQQLSADIHKEARNLLWAKMWGLGRPEVNEVFLQLEALYRGDKDIDGAFTVFKDFVGLENLSQLKPFFDHYVESRSFSIRSVDHMRRWLYGVKGYMPIKSTNRKEQNLPSMPWEKVLELSPEKQAMFAPSTDKQSLEILAESNDDALLKDLLLLNAVGNLCKAFLKEAEVDEDGELVKEEGLHYWLAMDGCVHGQMSTTETGRPRSWKPNCLNWPGFTREAVERGVRKALQRGLEEGMVAADDPALIWLEKSIPSIRSCVKAQTGWMMVESDYKTAELRGLAFISGDEAFIKMMTEPDSRFGFVMHKGKEEVVRIRWDENDPYTTGVSDTWLFSVAAGGEIKATYTEADLVRDAHGNVVHPDLDLHWDLAERVHQAPRETLVNKRDRGSAKVGNFCIAENEMVLTKRGPVAIQNVLPCDLLWDGLEWVHHEGVIYQGPKKVTYYQGLWATGEHEVWADDHTGKVHLEEARLQSLGLFRPHLPGEALEGRWFEDLPGHRGEKRERVFLRANRLSAMWCRAVERVKEHGKRLILQVPMSGRRQSDCQVAACGSFGGSFSTGSLSSHAAALRKGHSRILTSLQRAGYRGAVYVQGRLRQLGLGNLAGRIVSREGLRPDRQRWTLLQRELALGGSHYKPVESVRYRADQRRNSEGVQAQVSSGEIHGTHCAGSVAVRTDRVADIGARGDKPKSRLAKTYDILNAGPRNRFVCEGILVSNSSAYGASSNTLERKIEQDTGIKPEPGVGQKLLDALSSSRPVAFAFLKALEQAPKTPGYLVAASGRKRRFSLYRSGIGIDDRTQKGRLASQGREARNFFMQASVADTAARAGVWLRKAYRHYGLRAKLMIILYDSVVTLCPPEEREIVKRLHELYMCERNNWRYHGREMNYPIDTDFVARWSTDPKKEDPAESVWEHVPAVPAECVLPESDWKKAA